MATVKVKYLGGLRVSCEHVQSGDKIITDAPVDNHGRGEAFSPTDLCVTSLAACMMTIMGIYAQSAGIDVDGTEMEVTKKMASNPRRIGEIEVIFVMPAKNYSAKEKKALEKAAHTCPVSLSLREDVIKTVIFRWND